MNVAIQPAGSPGSREHYRDTIDTPVDLGRVERFLGPESTQLRALFPAGSAPMWGVTPGKRNANVSNDEKLRVGDLVLFLRDKKAFAHGTVAALFRNEALASHPWGRDDSGQTWENMYALRSVEDIDIPYPNLRNALGSSPGDNFMGFRVVSGQKAANTLGLLGELHVDPVEASWDIPIGSTLKRSDLHRRYGGAPRGGIEPSASTPNVFLFTDPSVGATYGYDYDGPGADGDYFFTGDGQVGDQQADRGGNKSLLEAEAAGRAIRPFRKHKTNVTYLGEFELADPPYEERSAMDRNGESRQVLVFHLLPVDADLQVDDTTETEAVFLTTPIERSNVLHFDQQRRSLGRRSMRRESQLRDAYARWARNQGADVSGGRIHLPGRRTELIVDLFDASSGRVIEAKSSSSRMHVREAIGQVLEYAFLMTRALGKPIRPAILTPSRPTQEMCDLLFSLGITAIWGGNESFHEATPPGH